MKILVDVDDVLADTFGALEDRFGVAADPCVENLEVMFPGVDLRSALDSIEFHLEIPPLDGAAHGVKGLLEDGHEAGYLSSRPSTMQEATALWLERNGFPGLPLQCVGRQAKKSELRTARYDLLIDDQVRYLTVAHERRLRTIALASPWNASWEGLRAADWDAILRSILEIRRPDPGQDA